MNFSVDTRNRKYGKSKTGSRFGYQETEFAAKDLSNSQTRLEASLSRNKGLFKKLDSGMILGSKEKEVDVKIYEKKRLG